MAAIIVNNVINASSQITYNYNETEELFGYDISATYTINVSDTAFERHDTPLVVGRAAIQEAYRRKNIVARIGGDEFLNGRITDVSFGEGTLVGGETATIVIEESRRLASYSSKNFSKYIPSPNLIENFDETYDFTRSGNTYSYTRNISLKYKQDAGDQFLSKAKVFLTNYYFENRPSYGYQEDGISENAKVNKNYRGTLSEKYDLLNLSVSLSENFDSSFINEAQQVSRAETTRVGLDESGHTTHTFSFNLTSLRLDSEDVLTSAIRDIIDENKAAYEEILGTPFSIQKGITQDGNAADLTIEYSSDPKMSQDTSVSYNGSSSKAGRFTEFSLSVEYSSKGKNSLEKFNNSKALWITNQADNLDKIISLFHPNQSIYEKGRSTAFAKTEGKVSEEINFTTDPSYAPSDDGLLKFKVGVSKTHKIRRAEELVSLHNLEGEVAVNNLLTVGQAQVTAEGTASQSLGIFKVKELLEAKTSELNDRVDEDIIHITSDELSLNLGDGTASRVINYIFI